MYYSTEYTLQSITSYLPHILFTSECIDPARLLRMCVCVRLVPSKNLTHTRTIYVQTYPVSQES